MSNAQIKQRALTFLSGNWGTAIGAMLLQSLIISAASAFFPIASLFAGILTIGYVAIFMSVIRTRHSSIETLFLGFKKATVSSLLAGLLVDLFTALWSLLFIIPGIVKSCSYAMTFYILNDRPELSAMDAITESRRMMNGHKADLFILHLSFIGWIFLSILTCGLLLFYVKPYMAAANAAFYESIKPREPVADAPVIPEGEAPAEAEAPAEGDTAEEKPTDGTAE